MEQHLLRKFSTEAIALDTAFRETPQGQTLSAQVRYERYMPADISKEDWVRLLGADVSNMAHMRLTFGLTKAFLKYAEAPHESWQGPISEAVRFNPEEKRLLMLTAITHDWAESITGDHSYDLKQAHHEEEEHKVLSGLVQRSDLSRQDAEAVLSILGDKTSKLGRAFNAIERVGYVRTALQACHVAERGHAESIAGARENLSWLVSNVLGNQIEALVGYASTLPPVRNYLSLNRGRISGAFAMVNESAFELYGESEAQTQREKFERAYAAWEQFLRA